MRTSSLNHTYRLAWSHVLNGWVAVSEITKDGDNTIGWVEFAKYF